MNISSNELNLLKYYRAISNKSKQKPSSDLISKFFPDAVYLNDEERELIQYYNELSIKDRRWIMGQMIDLIKKADEEKAKIPKAQ